MKINSVGGTASAGQTGMVQAEDAVSKNIRRQILETQKQLQELFSNEEISAEEKMKKRQELQKQITELNNQLRQHQIELRKEQQQAKGEAMENMLGGVEQGQPDSKSTGLSQTDMKAVISADSALSQAQLQNGVAAKLEGRAGVLKSEIKQDAGRGNVEAKQEELSRLEQKAAKANNFFAEKLADTDKEIKEDREEDAEAVSKVYTPVDVRL